MSHTSTCLSSIENHKMGMQNQDMNLVLSTDAKPRLKWTSELHQRFVEAVAQLGGADKATPKTLMRVMGIPGLTLYHLKSHLQKYRLGKSQQSETCSDNKQEEDYRANQSRDVDFNMAISDGAQNQINEGLKVAQALQMQMEVQRKLHEQIEVQRHLQLRIEAQGKYLQSVLKKAQETLSGYNSSSSSVGMELAKAELSQLVSMANTGGCTSQLSGLTETGGGPNIKDAERKMKRSTGGSMESSLTSSDSSDRKEEKQKKLKPETGDTNIIPPVAVLPLIETHSGGDDRLWKNNFSNEVNGRKRSGSTISDCNCVEQEQPSGKRSTIHKDKAAASGRSGNQLRKFGLLESFDLNSQYQIDINSGPPKTIDLNCNKGTKQINEHL